MPNTLALYLWRINGGDFSLRQKIPSRGAKCARAVQRGVGGENFVTERDSSTPVIAGNGPDRKGPAQPSPGRRSSRVKIDMPVEVIGQTTAGNDFREETRTTAVNAHGALILLTAPNEIKPSVALVNKKTNAKAQCRVVYRKKLDSGKTELGVEFVDPQPRFWGIAFPPEDWNWAERKRPGSSSK
jgi:hypothetical protein